MIWAFKLNGDAKIAQMPAPPPPPTELSFEANSRLRTMRVRETDAIKTIDYEYEPTRIQVTVGTRVTFTNAGQQPHNAAGADAGGWDIGLLNNGESASVTFNKPGDYVFSCTPHPFMIGEVIVTGQEIDGAPPVVVEGSGVKADGPMNMPEHVSPSAAPGQQVH
jgi:plastocyanin